jgi:hypothetical protein
LPVAGVAALTFACLQVVDTSSLDEGCPATQKPCSGKCVPDTDPDFGCANKDCHPCVIPNATAHCGANGSCIVATCQGEFLDCNHDGDEANTDGCETDSAHDPEHCGGCAATPCSVANGTAGCAAGHCAIALCHDGFRDCNFKPADGCEVDVTSDPANCGKCGQACGDAARCAAGSCL